MRLGILSNLRINDLPEPLVFLEHMAAAFPDGIILAGDVTRQPQLEETLALIADLFGIVLFVPGPHDCSLGTVDKLNSIKDNLVERSPNLVWLNREHTHINGQRFVGCTMWYNFNQVKAVGKTLDAILVDELAIHASREHLHDITYLNDTVLPTDIVITCFSPTALVLLPEMGSEADYWVVEPDRVLQTQQPKAWVFGRLPYPCWNQQGTTILASNPIRREHWKINPDVINPWINLTGVGDKILEKL